MSLADTASAAGRSKSWADQNTPPEGARTKKLLWTLGEGSGTLRPALFSAARTPSAAFRDGRGPVRVAWRRRAIFSTQEWYRDEAM